MNLLIEILPFILLSLLVFGIFVTPFLIINWFWRRKYVDKRSRHYKCGVCGIVTDPIWMEEGFFYKKYHCREHSSINRKRKDKE